MALINCPECNREISDKAKACPSCGLPIEIAAPHTDPSETDLAPNLKSCPSCNSHNTQSIKMMCLNGTSSGRSTGFGVSSDLDVGIGTMNSKSQTSLAERFSPGKSFTEIGCTTVGASLVFLFFGKVLDNNLGHVLFAFGIFFIVIGIMLLFLGSIPNKARESKIKLYENGWICHKCGYTWMPSNADPSGIIGTYASTDRGEHHTNKSINNISSIITSLPFRHLFVGKEEGLKLITVRFATGLIIASLTKGYIVSWKYIIFYKDPSDIINNGSVLMDIVPTVVFCIFILYAFRSIPIVKLLRHIFIASLFITILINTSFVLDGQGIYSIMFPMFLIIGIAVSYLYKNTSYYSRNQQNSIDV